MPYYAGDTYTFFLNIPSSIGTLTVISAPTITVLDISNPGSPIVTGQSMTLITGTSYLYYYAFASPSATPKNYVGLYSFATSNAQATGTATSAIWDNGIGTYTFPLPLPPGAALGNALTVTGFTPSGFNVTAAPIIGISREEGTVSVAIVSNPGSSEAFNLSGEAQIIADPLRGVINVGTVQATQISGYFINVGDSIAIASATSSSLNGTWIVTSAVLFDSAWTVTFYTTSTPLSPTAQSAGTLTDAVSAATGWGSGSFISTSIVSNQLITLSDELHIGDTYITGQVALQATVALAANVALDSTVMHASQYVAPANDPTVQSISNQSTTILSNTSATASTIGSLAAGTMSGLIQDIYDNVFGSWNIDQTQNPPVLYIKRINGDVIASFQLINTNTATQRNVLTNPPESDV